MTFCTAINCIDGRAQAPVTKFLKRRLRVRYVDMVTAPGVVRILAEQKDARAVEALMQSVRASVHFHESRAIAVVAHADCAGNPAEPEVQIEQIRTAVEVVRPRFPEATVAGLWVDERGRVRLVPPRAVHD